MKIQVTKEDITKSKELLKKSIDRSCHCPVALATKRAYQTTDAWVGGTMICVKGKSISVPLEATTAISMFDRFQTMEPFEFEVQDD